MEVIPKLSLVIPFEVINMDVNRSFYSRCSSVIIVLLRDTPHEIPEKGNMASAHHDVTRSLVSKESHLRLA